VKLAMRKLGLSIVLVLVLMVAVRLRRRAQHPRVMPCHWRQLKVGGECR